MCCGYDFSRTEARPQGNSGLKQYEAFLDPLCMLKSNLGFLRHIVYGICSVYDSNRTKVKVKVTDIKTKVRYNQQHQGAPTHELEIPASKNIGDMPRTRL